MMLWWRFWKVWR